MRKNTKKASQNKNSTLELIGRDHELRSLELCVTQSKNVLLEGPVGVGKTHLALSVLSKLKRSYFRIDGDSRYTEQKLSGTFDPAQVLKKGYSDKTFIPGPLTQAMQMGSILFINELNRLPEGVQNILLPAIDEHKIEIPRLGTLRAKSGFMVIGTQNPKEFVATSHLSEALLDRFELISMDYQSEAQELEILKYKLQIFKTHSLFDKVCKASIALTRLTRHHESIKRGASIRAALSIAELTLGFLASLEFENAFNQAVFMALPTRIEFNLENSDELTPKQELERLLKELIDCALSGTEKKK